MQKRIIKRSIWLLLAVCWMALIFAFSHQKASQSSEISGSLTYRMVDKVNDVFALDWNEAVLKTYAEFLEHPVRKAAHMTEYAILAWILLGNCMQYSHSMGREAPAEGSAAWQKNPYLWAFAGTAFYAATDEFHQLFIEGRSGEIQDVCIDSTGAILGLLFAWAVLCLWNSRKEKRQKTS